MKRLITVISIFIAILAYNIFVPERPNDEDQFLGVLVGCFYGALSWIGMYGAFEYITKGGKQ